MAVTFSRDKLKGTTKTQGDFNLAHRFALEIDGVLTNGVHKIEGLDHESEVIEYHDGEDGTTHYRPGRQKAGTIRIEKDFSSTKEFYEWRKKVVDGKVERKSISVIIHNDAGEEAMRYNFYDCWPRKYIGPALNARNSAHATEALEVCYERFEMK